MLSFSRNEIISRNEIPQGHFSRFRNSDATAFTNVATSSTVIDNLQRRVGAIEFLAIQSFSRDAEGFANSSRAACEQFQAGSRVQSFARNASSFRHYLNSFQRFDSPQEHAASLSFRQAGKVQAIVHAINEIHIRVTRGSKQNFIARSFSCGGVSGKIPLS